MTDTALVLLDTALVDDPADVALEVAAEDWLVVPTLLAEDNPADETLEEALLVEPALDVPTDV